MVDETDERPARILVVADRATAGEDLVAALHERAQEGPAQFRVVVTNPTRAELHPLHPERHDKAEEAERLLRETVPALERAVGGHVFATVSVWHDPMDAVDSVIFHEPVDEIIVALAPQGLLRRLHQDLPHRLRHHHLPVTVVEPHTV